MNRKIGPNEKCPCGSGKKYKKCHRAPSGQQFESRPGNYFEMKGKNAETIVHDLALKTFLTDWCYLNPKLPDGKELCDLLVVFDDITIIWQIKDLKLDENGRYKQAEVEKNLRQLSGARRQLFDLKAPIELENPRRGKEQFDPSKIKEVFLISVLLGEPEDATPFIQDIKDKTAHVFTKRFTPLILSELDTISDFCDYLRKKERLVKQVQQIIILGGEEELLAIYLKNNHGFGTLETANVATIAEGHWEGVTKNPQYLAKKKSDEISYGWDNIIDRVHEGSPKYELVARELARPNRFTRRYLSNTYLEAYIAATKDREHDIYRRLLQAKGMTYCFIFADDPEPRARRKNILEKTCFAARGKIPENPMVIGIATEKTLNETCTYDFCILNLPTWESKHQEAFERIQKEAGIWVNPDMRQVHETEYPPAD